jgi:catechol 2,3-dioxygenase-like lactoylglutathione lyase family enzyme
VRTWRSCVLDPRATRGVTLFAIEHADPAAVPPSPATAEPAASVTRLDHVVLFSDDLAGALALWRDRLGIPVRWRRELVERGTVHVGLRLGGVTIELAAPLAGAPGTRGERAWGLAYVVPDVAAAVARIRAAGLAASDVRTGIAPGSRVATVKWTDRLPTLLVQYASGPS